MCYIVFISHSLHWHYIKTALQEYVIKYFTKFFKQLVQEIFIYLPTNTHNRATHNSHQLKSVKGLNWWNELFIVFIEKALLIKIIIRSTN